MKQLMKEEAEANLFDDHKPRKRSVSWQRLKMSMMIY
jgi:hypothetical protein